MEKRSQQDRVRFPGEHYCGAGFGWNPVRRKAMRSTSFQGIFRSSVLLIVFEPNLPNMQFIKSVAIVSGHLVPYVFELYPGERALWVIRFRRLDWIPDFVFKQKGVLTG